MSVSSKEIKQARKTMWKALQENEGMSLGYEANIAMRMYDELHARGYKPKLKIEDRDEIAKDLLKLIFD